MTIYPSIMAKSQKSLNHLLKKLDGTSKYFHLDIADGKFVPNTSLWFNFKIPRKYNYAAHLMINHPLTWVKKHSRKCSIIVFHPEAKDDIQETINLIKKKKKKVGLALKPKTSIKKIKPYLDQIDYVLILDVNPGSLH